MSAVTPPPRHVRRWIALAIVAVLVALAAALAVHVHNLLQPQRFTTLLENELAAAGLKLEMQAPAEPTLFPHPGVQLQGFSLTNTGSDTPVLQANGATIVVPWRALLNGGVAIERIDVDAPRVDLDELKALLGRLPHHAGPPRLPTIATGVRLSQGTLLRAGAPLLFDISLATGPLSPGQTFQLDASARSAAGRLVSATITSVPSAAHAGVIDFNPLRVAITDQQGIALQLEGHANWHGGENLALQLKGTLRHAAFVPPASTSASAGLASARSAPAAGTVTDQISLDVTPARSSVPLTLALVLDGTDTHVDLRLQPMEIGPWWTRLLATKPGQATGPLPLTGNARVQRLDLGWLKATGLNIEAGPDLAPASGTTSGPAAGASAAH